MFLPLALVDVMMVSLELIEDISTVMHIAAASQGRRQRFVGIRGPGAGILTAITRWEKLGTRGRRIKIVVHAGRARVSFAVILSPFEFLWRPPRLRRERRARLLTTMSKGNSTAVETARSPWEESPWEFVAAAWVHRGPSNK